MDINISYYTSKGRRQNNEDSVSLMEGGSSLLAIVADGLGGHDDGEIASGQVVTSLNRMLRTQMPDEDILVDAIRQANQDIVDIQKPGRPMRTTVAVLWIGDYSVVAANVGDSRIYQFRDGKIIYQSVDHSLAQMAVLVGEMDKSEIRTCKDRNKLVRVLGNEAAPRVDTELLNMKPGDRFLMCSDGFWEPVTEETMLYTAGETTSAQQWLTMMRKFIDNANDPLQDNHSAIAFIVNDTK